MEDHWDKIIEAARGTCDSLYQILEQHDAQDLEDHMPFLNYLDQTIFCCEQCNWWCEISEMSEHEDWVCRDCVD